MADIKVTQADIDRADQWLKDLEDIDPSHETLMVLRKDFARHRIEAQRPLLEALEELLAAVDRVIKQAKGE